MGNIQIRSIKSNCVDFACKSILYLIDFKINNLKTFLLLLGINKSIIIPNYKLDRDIDRFDKTARPTNKYTYKRKKHRFRFSIRRFFDFAPKSINEYNKQKYAQIIF